ncbi:unnamed protein product [Ilex paraguariensis]|uniref:Target of rapamycin complex subunit LST8 n=1 Tax=Ilex paraguariensis TaxID=185542 RepID=A0ABC8SPJ9_9AQUA
MSQPSVILATASCDHTIRFWEAKSGRCYRTIQYPESVPEVDTAVRFLTVIWDGSLVVAANNHGTCYVWRLLGGTPTMTNFEPLHKLQADDGYILKCLLSPEYYGAYLITASSDTTARLWSMSTGEDIRVYEGHPKATVCCALNDGAEPSSY